MKKSVSYYVITDEHKAHTKPKAKMRKVNILLLLLFVALLIIGVFLGEVEIVIQKATMICLSCIGIG